MRFFPGVMHPLPLPLVSACHLRPAGLSGPGIKTVDGLDNVFGVNFVGHFELTSELMPLIHSTPHARWVSGEHASVRAGEPTFVARFIVCSGASWDTPAVRIAEGKQSGRAYLVHSALTSYSLFSSVLECQLTPALYSFLRLGSGRGSSAGFDPVA